MRAVREMLANAGFDMTRYHQESFAAPAPVPAPSLPAAPGDAATADAPAQEAVPVRFALSEVEGECLPGQTVLQAARVAGVRIPAACEFGLCGTCKTKKISGEVEMNHNGGILDDEIAEGFILACCSRPLGRLEVEA